MDLSCLCGITADVAPDMVGEKKGFAALPIKHLRDQGHEQEIKPFHCLMHQEALCAKMSMDPVMSVVIKAVNHRQF